MEEDFPLLRIVYDKEQAVSVATRLKAEGLRLKLLDKTPEVERRRLAGLSTQLEIHVVVHQDDLELAREFVEHEDAVVKAEELDESHFLHEFTDQELREVLHKPDEWSLVDLRLAQDLLRIRGVEFSEEELLQISRERLEQLREPSKDPVWKSLAIPLALAGGVFGIIMGLALWKGENMLPDQTRIPKYSDQTRNFGKRVVLLGIAGAAALVIFSTLY